MSSVVKLPHDTAKKNTLNNSTTLANWRNVSEEKVKCRTSASREGKMQNIFRQIPSYIFIAAIWKVKKSISEGTIHTNLIWAIHFHTLLILGRILLFLHWVEQGLLQATSQRVWFPSKLKQSCWQRASFKRWQDKASMMEEKNILWVWHVPLYVSSLKYLCHASRDILLQEIGSSYCRIY